MTGLRTILKQSIELAAKESCKNMMKLGTLLL